MPDILSLNLRDSDICMREAQVQRACAINLYKVRETKEDAGQSSSALIERAPDQNPVVEIRNHADHAIS
jgi:hypothetical protein